MIRYLLDTNVLSEALRPKPDSNVIACLNGRAHESAIPTPVLHELRYGGALLEPSRRRQAIDRFIADVVLRIFTILPYDRPAAEWHAKERARLGRAGRTPPYVDGMIAAIARVNGLVLVTANERDFQAFDGLTIESWKSDDPRYVTS
jgi:tRNA(fMet)-specific endonuclease VapC